jgi:hypothetical protein
VTSIALRASPLPAALAPSAAGRITRAPAPSTAGASRSRGVRPREHPHGVVAVTTRPAVRERLRSLSEALKLPPPRFVRRAEDVLGPVGDTAVLLLDLGSCCKTAGLAPIIRAWELYCPGSELLLFTPLLDRERELRMAVELVRDAGAVEVRVMTASDFYRDEVWYNVAEMQKKAALEAELRGELLEAVHETRRPLRAEPLVLELLHEAPRRSDVRVTAATPLERASVSVVEGDSARKARWRRLRRAGQLPASWLLLIFRVLWLAKLNEQGWPTERIAGFMGFASPRHLRQSIRRRFGLGVRVVKQVRYEVALRWAAALLTGSHMRLDRLTPRELVGPLLRPTASRVGAPAVRDPRTGRTR